MPDKSQSIILAGVAIGIAAAILNLIPTVGGCVACLIYLGAGMLAVWHYTDRHQLTLKGAQGAGLGALAGVLAGIIAFVLQLLFQAVGIAPGWREAMERGFENSNMDPAQIEEIMQTMTSPLVMIGLILVGLILNAVVGAIGGVIGASLFKKDTNVVADGGTDRL